MTEHLSLASQTPGTSADLTLGQAKVIVARVIGNEEDSTTLARAYDAIRMAVGEWNRRHQFDANAFTHADIDVTAGTASYDLPSNLLHVYDVRLETSQRTLAFIRRRLYDRAMWDQNAQAYPTHYTLFGSGNSGQIVLLPTPDAAETLRIRYYAGIVVPTDNDTGFGLPDRFAWGIVYKAKALLVMDKNAEDARIPIWLREAERAFREARSDDVERPDEDLRMIPSMEHRRRAYSQAHPYFGLQGEL